MQNTYNILVVEDEPAMQVLLRHNLNRAGFRVQLVDNGLAAQELLGTQKFDIICSDVMMSHMNGVELCAWVKTQPHLEHIPFVLLSSRAQRGDRELGLQAGADRYLTKPFDVPALISMLQGLIPENAQ